MDDVILRFLNGEATDVEQRRLEKWRMESPDHGRRYQAIVAVWEGLGQVSTPRAATRPDPRELMKEGERRRARSRASRSRRAVLRSPWLAYGLATAASLALVLVGAWVLTRAPGGMALTTVASSAGPGGVVALTLSDGTFVRVAPGAKLDFPAAAGRRELVLDGKAFFAVASDGTPFVVRTAAGAIGVRGTRFEVHAEGDAVQVIVVEGVVQLTGTGGQVDVEAGQVGTLSGEGAPTVASVPDVWSLLEWPGGLLAFQQTSLRDVAGQLTRHFGVDVSVQDSLVANTRVTGSFAEESLPEVVDALCAVTGIRCESRGDSVLIGVPPDAR